MRFRGTRFLLFILRFFVLLPGGRSFRMSRRVDQKGHEIIQFAWREPRTVVRRHKRFRRADNVREFILGKKKKSSISCLQLKRKIIFVANESGVLVSVARSNHNAASQPPFSIRLDDGVTDFFCRLRRAKSGKIRTKESTFALDRVKL